MTIPRDFRLIAKPCPFKAFRHPLTPPVSTLARPSLNLRVFYRFPATGGRGVWSCQVRSGVGMPIRYKDSESPNTRHRPRFSPHSSLLLSPLRPLDTNTSLVSLLFPLLTQKQGGIPPRKNVGAPTVLIFPLISRTFLSLATCPPRKAAAAQERSPSPYKESHGARDARHPSPVAGRRSLGTGHRPLLRSPCRFHHHSTPRLLRQAFPKRNLSESRQVPGARPAGMPAIAYRCPDAHD
jgi:hypothetical protein